jgi:hypothetical protein
MVNRIGRVATVLEFILSLRQDRIKDLGAMNFPELNV